MRRFTFGDFPFGRTQLKPQVRHLREELKVSRAAQEMQLCSLSRQVILQSNNICQIYPHLCPTWSHKAPSGEPVQLTGRNRPQQRLARLPLALLGGQHGQRQDRRSPLLLLPQTVSFPTVPPATELPAVLNPLAPTPPPARGCTCACFSP